MDGRGLENAFRIQLSENFQLAANHAFVPQNSADLIVAVDFDAAPIGRFHRGRFAGAQRSAQRIEF